MRNRGFAVLIIASSTLLMGVGGAGASSQTIELVNYALAPASITVGGRGSCNAEAGMQDSTSAKRVEGRCSIDVSTGSYSVTVTRSNGATSGGSISVDANSTGGCAILGDTQIEFHSDEDACEFIETYPN